MLAYYVYRHIRLDRDEPFYIGIGKIYGEENRYRRAFSKSPRSKFWRSVTNKSPIEVEIVYESDSVDEIIKKETEFIMLYGRRDIGTGTLVNLTNGGEGTRCLNEEALTNMRLRMIGNTLMVGIKLTEEHKNNIRQSNLGRVASKETKVRCSLAQKGNRKGVNNKGKKHSLATRQYLSKIRKNTGTKSILCTNTGQVFNSIMECSNLLFSGTKGNQNCISAVCNGKALHYKKYNFKFI